MAFHCRRDGGHLIADGEWAHLVPARLHGYTYVGEPWGQFICDEHVTAEELEAIAKKTEPRERPPSVSSPPGVLTARRHEILETIMFHSDWLISEKGHVRMLKPGFTQAVKITDIVRFLVDVGYVWWRYPRTADGKRLSRIAGITPKGIQYLKEHSDATEKQDNRPVHAA